MQRTGRWEAGTTDDLEQRGSRPAAVFAYEDIDEFRLAESVLRDGTGVRYVIRDIEHDGIEAYSRLVLEERP